MNNKLLIIGLTVVFGCASQKSTIAKRASVGDTRTKTVESLDDNTYLLLETSDDKTYGFEMSNPVNVGGVGEGSSRNQRRFLNALLGPNGEEVKYYREGSCCPFKTPNGPYDNAGLLDRYRVYWI